MGIFHPLDGLVVIRNRWLILLIKIWVFFLFKNNFSSKITRIQNLRFLSSFSACGVDSNFQFFCQMKVAEHICDLWCHLVAETDNWLILIVGRPRLHFHQIDMTWARKSEQQINDSECLILKWDFLICV
jgi:hypothetical protein